MEDSHVNHVDDRLAETQELASLESEPMTKHVSLLATKIDVSRAQASQNRTQ